MSEKAIADNGETNGATTAPPELQEKISLLPEQRPSLLERRRLIVALVLVLTIAAAAIVYRFIKSGSNAPAKISSVAVLPLKNLTGNSDDEYLADGLTEGLISKLSKVEGLKVILRGSVFAFKGKEVPPREAGARLGVMGVIEGSVLESKGSTRVTLRLVNTKDGRILWSHQSADRAASDFFEIGDELARKATVALRPELAAKEENRLARQYETNPEAYSGI